ncbi:MAG: protein TolR [Thermodesulfobacteriota bacterium]
MVADQRNSARLMSEINVTPFVDVMLVLLIIFMVTAPMMVQGVDIELPRTKTTTVKTAEDSLVLTINKERQVYINRLPIELKDLKKKLIRLMEARAKKELLFRADEQVPYGMVMEVMAEVRAAGIKQLGMITQPLEPDRDRR